MTALAPNTEALVDLIDYLRRAGVEPTRLALASLATDRGLDGDTVRALLDKFDEEARHGRPPT